jgi:hypothetical protein
LGYKEPFLIKNILAIFLLFCFLGLCLVYLKFIGNYYFNYGENKLKKLYKSITDAVVMIIFSEFCLVFFM